jgi:hypothetical protein
MDAHAARVSRERPLCHGAGIDGGTVIVPNTTLRRITRRSRSNINIEIKEA